MIEPSRFAADIAALCVAFGRQSTDELVEIYYRVLSPHFGEEEWDEAVRYVMESERFFPAPAVFLDRKRGADEAVIRAEGSVVYDRVLKCHEYSPHVGSQYRESAVRERLGDLAAQAFQAAGGASAFNGRDERGEQFVRRDFIDAYVRLAKADSEGRREIAAVVSRPALTPVRERVALPPSRAEAAGILEQIEARLPALEAEEADRLTRIERTISGLERMRRSLGKRAEVAEKE